LLILAVVTGCAPLNTQDLSTPATLVPGNQSAPTEATVPAATAPAITATQPPIATTVPFTVTPFASVQPELSGLPQVELAVADLALRLSVGPASIGVVAVEAVTWPNSALGCPQPGMAYAEALVEGLHIQLAYNGQVYNYHSGGSEPPFLCEQVPANDKSTPIFGDDILTPPEPDY
jgi:hypothetical protein